MAGLTDAQDAFGHLVLDCLSGERGVEVVERDDGFIGVSGGAEVYFAASDEWPPHCREAMSYVRARVLDVGCGAGRHALYLQARGFDVLGLDISPLAIEVCKRRGLKKARVLSIAHTGPRLGTFDTVLLLGANFGLLGSFRGARQMLKQFHAMTSAGARIVAESRDPYAVSDRVHVAYRDANVQRGRMPGQLRLRLRHKSYHTPWFDYLFVSKGEMEAILEGTGWAVSRYLDAAPENGGEYIAIVEKARVEPDQTHQASLAKPGR